MKHLPGTVYFLLALLACACSKRVDYDEFLANERVDLKIQLLKPESVLKSYVGDASAVYRIDEACRRDFASYSEAVKERKLWALKMLDASSKPPSGILRGNLVDLGSYSECTHARVNSSDAEIITGRHCMYAIDPSPTTGYTLPVYPSMSLCVPSSCSASDVINIVNSSINARAKSRDVRIVHAMCSTGETRSSREEVNVCLCIIGAYVSLLIACTCCDVYEDQLCFRMKKRIGTIQLLARFSLLRNARAILSVESRDSDLPFVHGIRVFSTVWIVLIHSYFVQFFSVNANSLDVIEWLTSWRSIPFIIGIFSVDTFFVLSGFLMTYGFFKKMEKSRRFAVFHYYLHRFNRLTLPMMTLVYLTTILTPNLGSGAKFEWFMNVYATGCRTKWWTFLLYVNNFVQQDNFCLAHLWSLAVEMQFFWVSPLILYSLHKRPKVGLIILAALFTASVVISTVIVRMNQYSAIYMSSRPELESTARSYKDVYTKPYTRASSWLMGILLGFVVTRNGHQPNRKTLYLGWLCATAVLAFTIYGINILSSKAYEYNVDLETAYAAFGRPAWAFVICWIIYVSMFDHGGVMSRMLSSNMLLPLSRISYSTYLVHMVILVIQVGSEKLPIFFNDYYILHSYIGNLILYFTVAFVYSLLFEIPALILNDVLFNERRHAIAHKSKLK